MGLATTSMAGTLFQSTPPARGATNKSSTASPSLLISIHAPREGGDLPAGAARHIRHDFNPRPPRGGRPFGSIFSRPASNFNPRPPRGGRPASWSPAFLFCRISIHAPREGGDEISPNSSFALAGFQSTPPARGATWRLALDG